MNETSGNKKIIYLCDPKKNKGCKKIACQDSCICTLKKECAVLDENGEIADIQVNYSESYDHQMMRYSTEYGTLI